MQQLEENVVCLLHPLQQSTGNPFFNTHPERVTIEILEELTSLIRTKM